jgi:hypothetical protein
MDSKKQNTAMKRIHLFLRKLLDNFVKANFHEYPIEDEKRSIIGTEFVTTHGGLMIRTKKVPKGNDKSASNLSLK